MEGWSPAWLLLEDNSTSTEKHRIPFIAFESINERIQTVQKETKQYFKEFDKKKTYRADKLEMLALP